MLSLKDFHNKELLPMESSVVYWKSMVVSVIIYLRIQISLSVKGPSLWYYPKASSPALLKPLPTQ